MDDLTRIAVEDTKHDLCDINPCRGCAPFRYVVRNNETVLGTYYGSNLMETQALNFAVGVAKSLWQSKKASIVVDVYDQNDHPDEVSCHYQIWSDGTYTKIG